MTRLFLAAFIVVATTTLSFGARATPESDTATPTESAAAAPVATSPPSEAVPAQPTTAPSAPVLEKSPWGVLGVVGGAVAGLGLGVSAVSTVVLLTEDKTTIKTYRYIELGVGSAEIATGLTLIVIDGLTE